MIMSYNRGTPCSIEDKATIGKRLEFIQTSISNVDKILDIGCGKGIYLSNLSNTAKQCVGLDISMNNLIEAIKIKNDNTVFVYGASEILPFQNGSFNVVLMIETLEHVENDSKCVEEVWRILKPGGVFILSVPNKFFPFETHGIKIGSKIFSSPLGLGFPLFTYLPNILRKRFATARVYTPLRLNQIITKKAFYLKRIDFLMPNMDIFEKKSGSKKISNLIKLIFQIIEESYFKRLGSSIIIQAIKKEEFS